MNAILKPIDRVEARIVAHRNKCHKALQDSLDAIILDRDFKLDVKAIIDSVLKAMEARKESHSDIDPIYANLQLIIDIFDALDLVTSMDVENDSLKDRSVKLEHAKIDVSRIKVTS